VTAIVKLMIPTVRSTIAIMRLSTAIIHVDHWPMSQMIAVVSPKDGVMKPTAAFITRIGAPMHETTAVMSLTIAVIHVVGAPDSLGAASLGQMIAPSTLDTPRVSPNTAFIQESTTRIALTVAAVTRHGPSVEQTMETSEQRNQARRDRIGAEPGDGVVGEGRDGA
jgi:hypothetical protein